MQTWKVLRSVRFSERRPQSRSACRPRRRLARRGGHRALRGFIMSEGFRDWFSGKKTGGAGTAPRLCGPVLIHTQRARQCQHLRTPPHPAPWAYHRVSRAAHHVRPWPPGPPIGHRASPIAKPHLLSGAPLAGLLPVVMLARPPWECLHVCMSAALYCAVRVGSCFEIHTTHTHTHGYRNSSKTPDDTWASDSSRSHPLASTPSLVLIVIHVLIYLCIRARSRNSPRAAPLDHARAGGRQSNPALSRARSADMRSRTRGA